MRVYISGPMSGYENCNREAFWKMEEYLIRTGHKDVFNPANIPIPNEYQTDEEKWHYCMPICLREVTKSHRIVMLKGWQKSQGAKMELLQAIVHNLDIEVHG